MNRLLHTSLAICLAALALAQAPERVKYQAVVRDADGAIVQGQNVSFRISVLEGSTIGMIIYSETHAATTNDFGLVDLEIGGGVVQSGDLSTIQWGSSTYFFKVEVDPDGGNAYQTMGTTQALSVPYALYAKSAGSASGSGPWFSTGANISNANTGNVGIGTTTPEDKLDVNGQARIKEHLTFNSANGVVNWGPSGSLFFRSLNVVGDISGYNDRMTITASGNVGVGTTTPAATVDIVESSNATGAMALRLNNPSNRRLDVFSPGSDVNAPWIFDTPNSIKFRTDGNDIKSLYLDPNGSVGIGTTNPQSKLAVNGKITCKEVEVTLAGFPDYVFEKDYHLLPLQEVAAYIEAHGHLPNVPSACEVEENGLGLGEMNKILLEKVEELTLHLIEKDRLVSEMMRRLTSMEERMGTPNN